MDEAPWDTVSHLVARRLPAPPAQALRAARRAVDLAVERALMDAPRCAVRQRFEKIVDAELARPASPSAEPQHRWMAAQAGALIQCGFIFDYSAIKPPDAAAGLEGWRQGAEEAA